MNKKLLVVALTASFIVAGCSNNSINEETKDTASPEKEVVEQQDAATENSSEANFLMPFDGTASHVHGMGYIESDGGLYFATHAGLKVYENGSWFETDGQFNDYMGFSAVDGGFYTSGHPGTDSDLPNPIGIQKSTDAGRSLESLGFEGETDFHLMAAGYQSHDLFVMNPQENSKMDAGFYLSENDGVDWQRLKPEGIKGELIALAIHPENSQFLAVASDAGVYLSEDGGKTFNRLTDDGDFGTAVHFTADKMYFASHGSEAVLKSYAISDGTITSLELPELKEDGAVYIAVNPENSDEIALNTAKGDAFVSSDGGESWEEIINEGQVQ